MTPHPGPKHFSRRCLLRTHWRCWTPERRCRRTRRWAASRRSGADGQTVRATEKGSDAVGSEYPHRTILPARQRSVARGGLGHIRAGSRTSVVETKMPRQLYGSRGTNGYAQGSVATVTHVGCVQAIEVAGNFMLSSHAGSRSIVTGAGRARHLRAGGEPRRSEAPGEAAGRSGPVVQLPCLVRP